MTTAAASPSSVRGRSPLGYEKIASLTRAHLSKGRASMAEFLGGYAEVFSEGPYIYTHDGERFLSAGGFGQFILGHRHPRVVESVIRQIQTHPLTSKMLIEPAAARAVEALMAVVPDGLEHAYFCCSGSEAIETAIKMARSAGKQRLISTWGGFHGKTMGALSVTARELYQQPFEPLLPLRSHVPFGDIDALRTELAAAPSVSCVILEPIQGEGGVHIPPAGYLRAVRQLCDEYDAFLVFDEILTGLGRTGSMWRCDTEGVSPDILAIGKGISGGVVPVGAAVATKRAFSLLNKDPMMHSSTFSAAPIAMAAVEASVRTVVDEDVVTRAATIGQQLIPALRATLTERCGHLIRDVRGAGLLVGIEVERPEVAGDLILELFAQKVIVCHSLNNSTVVRLTPPVCLSPTDITWLLSAVGNAADALAEIYPDPHRH